MVPVIEGGLGAVVGHVATVVGSAQVADVIAVSAPAGSLHSLPSGLIDCYTDVKIAPHGRHPG